MAVIEAQYDNAFKIRNRLSFYYKSLKKHIKRANHSSRLALTFFFRPHKNSKLCNVYFFSKPHKTPQEFKEPFFSNSTPNVIVLELLLSIP